MIMSTIVLSIGGSILAPENIDIDFIRSLAALFKKHCNDNKFYIVVGGGRLARKYINIARTLGANEILLDEIGISSTRLNAQLLISALDEFVFPKPALTIEEALVHGKDFPMVVMGGTHPGHTTDAVAMMLAEYINADKFINATSVDGVYTADPAIEKDAKKLDRLTPDKLIEITFTSPHQAGPHIVIDPLAARIIKRSKITAYVLDGRDLTALENAIIGKQFVGSIIEE
jgi:uridylate kinase